MVSFNSFVTVKIKQKSRWRLAAIFTLKTAVCNWNLRNFHPEQNDASLVSIGQTVPKLSHFLFLPPTILWMGT
jgi:hypothetical protein